MDLQILGTGSKVIDEENHHILFPFLSCGFNPLIMHDISYGRVRANEYERTNCSMNEEAQQCACGHQHKVVDMLIHLEAGAIQEVTGLFV